MGEQPGATTLPEVIYRAPAAARLAGISYRQLDYWVRTGLIPVVQEAHGSGSYRLLDVEGVIRLRLVRHMYEAGIGVARARLLLQAIGDTPLLSAPFLVVSHGSALACPTIEEAARELIESGGWVIRTDELAQGLGAA